MRLYFLVMFLLMMSVTYSTRLGLLGVARQVELHPMLRRALEYVPVSILATLVFPAILAPAGKLAQPLSNVYVWAGLVTAGVLLLARRQWLAIVVGMASVVLLRGLLGG